MIILSQLSQQIFRIIIYFILLNKLKQQLQIHLQITVKKNEKNLKKIRINIIAEQTLMQILNTGTEEYFMQQLYKFPLTGLKIEIYLNQKLIQGIIALETKNIIYIVTSEYKTKQFYKKNLVFVILINLNRYLIMGNNLKLNRFN